MPRSRDFYTVLGLSRDADADQIRSAHRRLARELHPDVNKAPDASKRFAEVQEAYDVLSDPEKRAVYDSVGHEAFRGGVTGAAAGQPGASAPRSGVYTWTNVGGRGGQGSNPFNTEDIGSIFEEFFGGMGADTDEAPGRRARAKPPGRARDADIEHTIEIPLLTALQGGVTTLRLDRGGATETIEVRIPRGVDDGATLRLRGQGQRGRGGRGDLLLTVRVAPHPVFRREGLDISADLPVSIFDAALGGKATVATPAGDVEVTIPEGTSGGARLRLRGRGVTTDDGRVGDFHAVVKIVSPPRGVLTEDEKRTLRQIRDRLK